MSEDIKIKGKFTFGIMQATSLQNSEDLIVAGHLYGEANTGDVVCIENIGDDNTHMVETRINGILKEGEVLSNAKDCFVELRLDRCSDYPVKIGTIVYQLGAKREDKNSAYINALGDMYIGSFKMELNEEDYASLSINDCQQLWYMYSFYCASKENAKDEKFIEENKQKIELLVKALCSKILAADTLFCVMNKNTQEPHLFTQTEVLDDATFRCTPPNIMLVSKANKDNAMAMFDKDPYELRKVEKGSDGQGIINLIGGALYLNGAIGVAIQDRRTVIQGGLLVPKPDFSDVPKQNIPVTNPDLERWILLMGQLGKPETEDEKTQYGVYYRMLASQMPKARFLVPMMIEGDGLTHDESGKFNLPKGSKVSVPQIKGKGEKPAIPMFTDWKRFKMAHGDSWGAGVDTVERMVDSFDCAINPTSVTAGGCYVNKDTFEIMKKISAEMDGTK